MPPWCHNHTEQSIFGFRCTKTGYIVWEGGRCPDSCPWCGGSSFVGSTLHGTWRRPVWGQATLPKAGNKFGILWARQNKSGSFSDKKEAWVGSFNATIQSAVKEFIACTIEHVCIYVNITELKSVWSAVQRYTYALRKFKRLSLKIWVRHRLHITALQRTVWPMSHYLTISLFDKKKKSVNRSERGHRVWNGGWSPV